MLAVLDVETIGLESTERLNRDLVKLARTLTLPQVRYLVDYYYQIQEGRKRADNQQRAMAEEPHEVICWLGDNTRLLEGQIKRALDAYTDSSPSGAWAKSIVGIGPVIAAGLLAHINIEQAPTVGHIWRFAGLDPTVTWEKSQRRPWNARLKTLCWKIGQSFMKVQNNPNDFYGQFYVQRKASEVERNEAGALAEQAAVKLEKFRIGKGTEAYKAYSVGKLPPAHIDARARRWTVKLFLSHYHHVAYELRYGCAPPKPYILTRPEHVHFLVPPNWPV